MARFNCLSLALALGMGLAHPARAEFLTVYNTGVNPSGALLPNGAVDPHYTLVRYPAQVGTTPAPAYALSGITFSYIVSGTDSRWISWSPTWIDATPSGVWFYRTTVDLTGFLPATASVTGRFASDDDAAIYLNGTNTGVVSTRNDQFTSFQLTGGFVPGVNTIDFRVENAPFVSFNPSALRVEMTGTAAAVTAAPAPPPLLLGAPAMILGLLYDRRNKKRFQ